MPQSKKPRKQHKPKPKFHPVHGSGTMSSQDIIQQSLAKTEPDANWEDVYDAIYTGIQSNKFRMLRHKNSLLFFQVETPVASNMHIFTTESPEELKKSFVEFGKAFKASGYKKMTGTVPSNNRAILRLLRNANNLGFKIQETPIYANEGDVEPSEYDIVIEIGK